MKKLIALTVLATLAVSAPAQAQMFNSGNSGLLGLANNLLGIQTGNISILNGGILNGSNLLSGIGIGARANANNASSNTTGTGHAVLPATPAPSFRAVATWLSPATTTLSSRATGTSLAPETLSVLAVWSAISGAAISSPAPSTLTPGNPPTG